MRALNTASSRFLYQQEGLRCGNSQEAGSGDSEPRTLARMTVSKSKRNAKYEDYESILAILFMSLHIFRGGHMKVGESERMAFLRQPVFEPSSVNLIW